MANQFDLEEQEQIDQLKHFWKHYGNRITALLVLVLGAVLAWNGYQYWQTRQSEKASLMYDEVVRTSESGDASRMDRALADMQARFANTLYAAQAALLVARTHDDKGNTDGARAALTWVASHAADSGYQAVAKLRLAGILLDKKAYDEALAQLAGSFSVDFAPLASDRRGDILAAQGKLAAAKTEYSQAYKGLDQRVEYRRLVEFKLNSLGIDPTQSTGSGTPSPTTSSPAAPATSAAAPALSASQVTP